LDEDESYQLQVSDQKVQLTAPTVVGALRGVETLLQLLSVDRSGSYFPAVKVQDQPRFHWRGLLIDVGRHYQPPEVLKRNLDAMAAVKLNVFHWHLTEDQGFRVESKKFPRLHQLGSDGLYYTQDQIREIIDYARERGIRVVPEFDIPGHSTSWLVGHPELGSAPGPYTIERGAGIFEPALDPTREEVYKFLDIFLGEMASLFPDAYMHIGGDENEGKQWDRNPKIQAFMKEKGIKDNHALQAYFNTRVLKILEKHKKKMIGWDEILQPELPKNAVIHSWRGPAALADAAGKDTTAFFRMVTTSTSVIRLHSTMLSIRFLLTRRLVLMSRNIFWVVKQRCGVSGFRLRLLIPAFGRERSNC
jgi:N-acetyl-beta-hexosaminidase